MKRTTLLILVLLCLNGCAVLNPVGQAIERIDGAFGKILTPHPKATIYR